MQGEVAYHSSKASDPNKVSAPAEPRWARALGATKKYGQGPAATLCAHGDGPGSERVKSRGKAHPAACLPLKCPPPQRHARLPGARHSARKR